MAAQASKRSGVPRAAADLRFMTNLNLGAPPAGQRALGALRHPRHSCGHCLTPLPAQNTPPPNRSGGPSQTRAAYLKTDKRYSLIFWE